jgi:hypothetical protein
MTYVLFVNCHSRSTLGGGSICYNIVISPFWVLDFVVISRHLCFLLTIGGQKEWVWL